MKAILSKTWYGVPILVFALVAVLGVGAVYAAMVLHTSGTVTVVATGGGGTPLPTPTYLFKLYDAVSGGNEIAAENNTFFNLGNINVSSTLEKTIYAEKTGTGSVTVTPALSNLDPATGTIIFTPVSVTVTNSTRLPIAVKFTAGAVPAAADAFDITFTGNP
jgi:hypothetical protein